MFDVCELKNAREVAEVNLMLAKYFRHLEEPRNAEWEWERSPAGAKRIVAKWAGKIIGHYGLIGYPLLVNGQTVEGGKIEGSFVESKEIVRLHQASKDPRLKNTFKEMIAVLLADLKSKGENYFVFGIPNTSASKSQFDFYDRVDIPFLIFRSMDNLFDYAWGKCSRSTALASKLSSVRNPLLRKIILSAVTIGYGTALSIQSAQRRLFGKRATSNLRVEKVTAAQIPGEFLEWMMKLPFVTIFRSADYLDWRFDKNTINKTTMHLVKSEGRCVAFFALMQKGTALYLEDLVVREMSPNLFGAVHSEADRVRQEVGASTLIFKLQDHPVLRPFFEAINESSTYFLRETENVSFIYSTNLKSANVANPDWWYVTRAFYEGS